MVNLQMKQYIFSSVGIRWNVCAHTILVLTSQDIFLFES